MFPLTLSRPEVDELNSLMETGRKDVLWRSVLHRGGMSLMLKVLLVERVSVVVHNTMQFTQHPPLRHHQERVQLDPQDGASLPDDLVELVGICFPQSAAPAHQTKKMALATTDW